MDEETVQKYEDFEKKRKRGIQILVFNEIVSVIAVVVQWFLRHDWVFWTLIGYLILSTIFLINRTRKKNPSDQSNYIFGKSVGDKMVKTPQKFIYEVMMMSLSLIILTDLFGTTFTIFFTDISLVYKIITGVSGYFGAAFMLMILISTFQQYKSFIQAQSIVQESLKGGEIEEWLNKK